MKAFEVLKAAQRIADAAQLLLKQDHQIPALMLTYAGIDQVAWLAIENEKSNSADFMNWVEKYMLSKNPMPCTARELWEARNGLLHMATSESAAIRRDPTIRKIYYTFGKATCTRNDSTDVVIVNVDELVMHFVNAVLWFLEDLQTDAKMAEGALDKLSRTMKSQGLTT